jgi:hypothetical protein
VILTDFGYPVYTLWHWCSQAHWYCLAFQSLDLERTWWRLFQKRIWWRLFQKRIWWRLLQSLDSERTWWRLFQKRTWWRLFQSLDFERTWWRLFQSLDSERTWWENINISYISYVTLVLVIKT